MLFDGYENIALLSRQFKKTLLNLAQKHNDLMVKTKHLLKQANHKWKPEGLKYE